MSDKKSNVIPFPLSMVLDTDEGYEQPLVVADSIKMTVNGKVLIECQGMSLSDLVEIISKMDL